MEKTFHFHPIRATVAIVLTIAVLVLSLMPGSSVPKVKIPNIDKLVHIGMYFFLTISYYYGFFNSNSKSLKPLVLSAIVASLFGFLIEILQHFAVSTRYFDELDILANVIGCFFAILFVKKLSLSAQIKL
jgi:VanZ family protein